MYNVGLSIRSNYSRYHQDQVVAPLVSSEEEVLDTSYIDKGIAKYFISGKVFTMRTSHSITLSKAQIVKQLLDVSRELVVSKNILPAERLAKYLAGR